MVFYENEQVNIIIPDNNQQLHMYYRMFPGRDNCEVLFRLLIKYIHDENLLHKNKNIIDLGAWIGDNAIPWGMRISGYVYAIDPSEENIKYINTLCKLNNLHNVKTIQKPISDKIENVFTSGDLKHTEFNCSRGNTKLVTTTIDVLYESNIIDDIGFIHLDVEGFEHKVLNGSINLIKKFKPVIVWENHLKTDNYKGTTEFLNSLEYDTFMINEQFPHCRPDCRNFFSVHKSHIVSSRINQINEHFKDIKINNRADRNKDLLTIEII